MIAVDDNIITIITTTVIIITTTTSTNRHIIELQLWGRITREMGRVVTLRFAFMCVSISASSPKSKAKIPSKSKIFRSNK